MPPCRTVRRMADPSPLSDAQLAARGLPPSAAPLAHRAAEVLRGVDLAELDATGQVVYAAALALTSVAASASGLDDLDRVVTWLEQIATR